MTLPILNELKKIIFLEIDNSRQMLELCSKDKRLGYHSEAEAFKFYPSLLEERILYLENLLKTEFSEVENRISNNKPPLAYYEAEGEDCYFISKHPNSSQLNSVGTSGAFTAWYDKNNVYLNVICSEVSEITFCFEGKIMSPSCEIIVRNDVLSNSCITYMHNSMIGDKIKKELSNYSIQKTADGYIITASRIHIGWTDETKPFKLMLKINSDLWIKDPNPCYNLGNSTYSAGEFGFIRAMDCK